MSAGTHLKTVQLKRMEICAMRAALDRDLATHEEEKEMFESTVGTGRAYELDVRTIDPLAKLAAEEEKFLRGYPQVSRLSCGHSVREHVDTLLSLLSAIEKLTGGNATR